MRLEIDAQPDGGLSVIPDLPNFALTRVEGRNGIGKTLAIKILELCTGSQPYRDPLLWSTLRAGLGDVSVRVTQLRSATSIDWSFNTRDWPTEPSEPDDSWFDELRVDGESVGLEVIRQLLRVVRIDGSETLVDAIAARIQKEQVQIEQASRRLRSSIDSWDEALAALDADLRRVNPARLLAAQHELQTSRLESERVGVELAALSERLGRLSSVAGLARTIRDLDQEAPGLREERDHVESRLATLNDEIKQLDLLVEQQRPRLEARSEQVEMIREHERVVERRGRLRSNTRTRVETLAGSLGSADDRLAVERLAEAERQLLREAAEERSRLDSSPQIERLGLEIGLRLEAASSQGLANEVVAELQSSEITVQDLAAGVVKHRESLRRQAVGDDVQVLNRRIAELTRRQEQLSELLRLIQRLESNQRSFDEAQAQLTDLRGRLIGPDAEEFNKLVDSLEAARLAVNELHSRRAVLTHQLNQLSGGRTRAEIEADLEAGLERLGLDAADLDETANQLREQVIALRSRSDDLRTREAELEVTVADELGGLRGVVRLLKNHDGYRWLRETVGPLLPAVDADDTTALRTVERLSSVVTRFRARLGNLQNDVEAMGVALGRLADRVSQSAGARPTSSSTETRYMTPLRTWLGQVLTAQFSGPEIAEALFEGGRVEDFDLEELTVIWRTDAGGRKRRPLTAFSSGERAFAFTLARLESLEFGGAANRLVALDEFGAYVDHDRMAELVVVLQRHVLGVKADQIVVIVPLSHDYASELNPDPDASREVATTGYFAVDLAAGL